MTLTPLFLGTVAFLLPRPERNDANGSLVVLAAVKVVCDLLEGGFSRSDEMAGVDQEQNWRILVSG